MEIFSTGRKQFIVGLLIYLICLLSSDAHNPLIGYAEDARDTTGNLSGKPAWSYVWSQTLRAMRTASVPGREGVLYTDTDITFTSELENITPDSVNLSLNSLPRGVRLVSSKKEAAFIKNDDDSKTRGTRITLVLRFPEAATYRMQPLDLVIGKDFYQMPFESVTVMKNPRTVQSEIRWAFDSVNDGNSSVLSSQRSQTQRNVIVQGESAVFTVSVKNCEDVIDVFWDIPENCVFRKTRDFDFPSGGASVPETYYPVATFEWTPLTAGDAFLPKITVKVRTYNNDIKTMELDTRLDGMTLRVVLPSETGEYPDTRGQRATVNGQDSATTLSARPGGSVPSPTQEAVTAAPDDGGTEERASDVTRAASSGRADAARIAELRGRERHAFPFSDEVYNERRAREAELGLSSPAREPNIVILLTLFGVSALFLVALLIVFFLRRKISFILSGGVVLSLGAALLYTSRFLPEKAVYSGGKISFIPEEAANQIVTLPAGSVVSVKETAGEWAYIERLPSYSAMPGAGEGVAHKSNETPAGVASSSTLYGGEGWTLIGNLFFIR